MGLLILGATRCPICARLIEQEDSIVNFPPIFVNEHHAVFEVTDAVVHRSCLAERPYAQLAIRKLAACEERRLLPRVCRICGRSISDPDDYFGTGPLADDPAEDVARLDWFEAHIQCLRTWAGRSRLAEDLRAVSGSPVWEGDILEKLASALEGLEPPHRARML